MQKKTCRSASEILGGAVALAIVALIAVGSAHIAPPQPLLPATPPHYASTAIEPSEEVAKLSLNEEDQPRDGAGKARNAQSSVPISSATAVPEPVVPVRAPPPSLPPAPSPPLAAVPSAPPTTGWSAGRGLADATVVQQPRTEALLQRRSSDIAESSSRLRSGPRFADIRAHDTPAPAPVRAAPTFVGRWSDDINRCRVERKAPLVISTRAAKTADGECDFGSVAREAANRWRVAAICTTEGQFWRANIALTLVEPKLTWSSERGTETYVRCTR